MAKPIEEAEAALREFGKRYRDAFFKNHPASEKSAQTIQDAVREQYEQEQESARESLIEPPVIESPIKPKDHEQEQERGPEEPDQGR
jgi:hypothetical protein